MIGISLLTLNLEAAGGTLTHVEQLNRALARVGELEYRAGRGAGRLLGMAASALRGDRLRKALRPGELDAIHFPLGVMIPRLDAPPAAATIHDLQHEAYPQFFSRGQLAYRRRVYGWTVGRSRIVIAVSEHGRGELIERFGLDPEGVRAIHNGVDHERFRPDGRPREEFLLYPANAWPHKNHARLFDAFALVRRDQPDLRLVLTGAGHERLRLPEGVESRGHIALDELVDLYRSAAALAYASLYEGFGIPCLEAMACGCPVACSDAASLPEICGPAAVYFDPLSVESIAQAIRDVLDRPPAGEIERAAEFTWERCARGHDAVYRELANVSGTD